LFALLTLAYCESSLFKRSFHDIVVLSVTVGKNRSTRTQSVTQRMWPTNFIP